jgi:hypothetical protein
VAIVVDSSDFTFLSAVTRILRLNAVLRGDTDAPSSFSDTNHNSSMQLAIVAVQDELAKLAADKLLPVEKSSATVTLLTSTRTYTLAADFINFYGHPHFYDATSNRILHMWPGGQENLQIFDFKYLTTEGTPNWWYIEPATSKKVGFYNVPDSSWNNVNLTYHYERSLMVEEATDEMPFHNTEENYTFCALAGRRFKFMFEDVDNKADIQQILDNDVSYRTALGTLMRLIRGVNPPGSWAPVYR